LTFAPVAPGVLLLLLLQPAAVMASAAIAAVADK